MAFFSDAEVACKCGCGFTLAPDFRAKLEQLRERYGKPLVVTSAARCPAHNAKVSGTGTTGPHTTGRAADFAVSHGDALKLIELALQQGFTGIGVQQKGAGRYIHVDDLPNAPGQPRPTIWSYP